VHALTHPAEQSAQRRRASSDTPEASDELFAVLVAEDDEAA
jgi:hypothetical protein